jgi:hypothetical protein
MVMAKRGTMVGLEPLESLYTRTHPRHLNKVEVVTVVVTGWEEMAQQMPDLRALGSFPVEEDL